MASTMTEEDAVRKAPSSRGVVFDPWLENVHSSRASDRIDDCDTFEILFIVGDNHTIVGFCNGGDNSVEAAAWPAFGFSIGHQPRPDQACFLVEGEDPAWKKRLRTLPAR